MSGTAYDTFTDGLGCRVCLKSGIAESDRVTAELIAPCHCHGLQLLVHRVCLNNQRARGTSETAWTHCQDCHTEYQLESSLDSEDQVASRKCRLCLWIARDVLACFLAMQLTVIGFGGIISLCDTSNTIRDSFPTWISDHAKTTYYVCGLLLFFLLLGLTASIYACRESRQGCNCTECPQLSCTGPEGIIIVLILVVVLVFIGVFVCLFLIGLFVQRLLQRQIKSRWLLLEANRRPVIDRFEQELRGGEGVPPPRIPCGSLNDTATSSLVR